MKTKSLVIAGIILAIIIIASVPLLKKTGKSVAKLPDGVHKVEVEKVIQGSNYTYLLVSENKEELWLAIAKSEVKEDEILYFTDPLLMNNFTSKELNRTFESIYFVQKISDKLPLDSDQPISESGAQKAEITKLGNIKITPKSGEITIAELFENHAKYAGKIVTITGIVSKYSPMIMDRNWAHIQDGTEFSGEFDLTVTTADSLEVGNQVTFSGKISLNKDFGAGYFYKIIMEDAQAADIKPVKQ